MQAGQAHWSLSLTLKLKQNYTRAHTSRWLIYHLSGSALLACLFREIKGLKQWLSDLMEQQQQLAASLHTHAHSAWSVANKSADGFVYMYKFGGPCALAPCRAG